MKYSRAFELALLCAAAIPVGCGGGEGDSTEDAGAETAGDSDADTDTDADSDADAAQDSGPPDSDVEAAVFECRYSNPFSHADECKEYRGDWTEADAKADCDATFSNEDFVAELSHEPCDLSTVVGSCEVEVSSSRRLVTRYYDLSADQLTMAEEMCESFLGGVWVPADGGADGGVDDECEALIAEAMENMVSSENVTVDPECVDDACLEELIAAGGWIAFTPTGTTPTSGLVFYPGGGVDPRLYAPVLQIIANEGFFVALVPMPGNSALSGYDRAGAVIAGNPEQADWFIAGHSLGGIGVEAFVKDNPTKLRGFIHWASYGSGAYDISDVSIAAVSVYGTNDGLSTVQEVEDGAAYLPTGTEFVKLEGANHAQFGHLCSMDGDNEADISRELQQELASAATTDFMRSVLAAGESAQ